MAGSCDLYLSHFFPSILCLSGSHRGFHWSVDLQSSKLTDFSCLTCERPVGEMLRLKSQTKSDSISQDLVPSGMKQNHKKRHKSFTLSSKKWHFLHMGNPLDSMAWFANQLTVKQDIVSLDWFLCCFSSLLSSRMHRKQMLCSKRKRQQ